MILSYIYDVNGSQDLRAILAQNIRNARGALHISQARLAEYANISLPSMVGIEHCKTWVSDKTLKNIAKALNKEAYELLIPLEKESGMEKEQETQILKQIADLINGEKNTLKKTVDDAMDGLLGQIIRLYSVSGNQYTREITTKKE
ncbi:MAG: helix-turn-helix domain-containing protein [Treponema sp.]|jgi:transcriptional regulator with XRE-family HTH domain|nr:helix-turn-helix domain-containing protein [Treponema sp.]